MRIEEEQICILHPNHLVKEEGRVLIRWSKSWRFFLPIYAEICFMQGAAAGRASAPRINLGGKANWRRAALRFTAAGYVILSTQGPPRRIIQILGSGWCRTVNEKRQQTSISIEGLPFPTKKSWAQPPPPATYICNTICILSMSRLCDIFQLIFD